MDIKTQYTNICNELSQIVQNSLNDSNAQNHAKASCFLNDVMKVLSSLDKRYEFTIYQEALNEYRNCLLFWSTGLYKHAYMALRSYFELFLFGIKLSHNEFEFRLWKNGNKDLYWSEITDDDNGIFSSIYIKSFCIELIEYNNQYGNLAKTCYRVCSEYIHNNYNRFIGDKPIEFNQDEFDNISTLIKSINNIICFQFFVRYWDWVSATGSVHIIEDMICDNIGFIPEIDKLVKGV